MKKFHKELESYKEAINKYLDIYFKQKIIRSKQLSPFNIKIIRQLADYTLRGGKRLRSILFLYGYESAGKKISSEIIKLSIFLELLQTSLLIHDDIMDKSDLRRGQITVHKFFAKGKSVEFGNSIAIIAGDIAMQYAYEIIAQAKIGEIAKTQLIENVSYYLNLVNFGQAEDVHIVKNKDFNEKEIEFIHQNKTAAYTTLMPLVTGAVIAGVNQDVLKTLKKYAVNVGIAFQIIDDVIGVFGNQKEIGKSVTSDIAEGKKTLLILYAMKKIKLIDQQFLASMLGNNSISKNEFNKVKYLLYQSGALHNSFERANHLIDRAINIIKNSSIDLLTQDRLTNLAFYILHKDKINLNFRTKI